jgi:hypothetical protein
MKKIVRHFGLVAGASLLVLAGGLLAEHARAGGIPAANALTYTGYLETPDGAPLTDTVSVSLALWAASSGGKKVCDTGATKVTPLAGRFQVQLPEECSQSVHAQPDLWLEASINGTALGRTKLGAVPFAIEADHASNADSAQAADAASGALDDRIKGVEANAAAAVSRLDAARSVTLRKLDETVDVEVSDNLWVWVTGTDSATAAAGRYSLYTYVNVNAGLTGCTQQPCKNYGTIKVAACVKVGNNIDQVGAPVYVMPQSTPNLPVPTVASDVFELKQSTKNVQFGLCGSRPGDVGSSADLYNARLREVLSLATFQPD